ncbi:hypothetical protein [Streptomyces mirabilis]|uniref:hypothetical protein n=1 Tax=Streptomyces mirabilis TaxID=68239 RepID=UPI0034103725
MDGAVGSAQNQESQQISRALGVLTILGLPLGTALSILQVLDGHSTAHLVISLALSVAERGGSGKAYGWLTYGAFPLGWLVVAGAT